jgi:26S proteasome regulatory subunit T5
MSTLEDLDEMDRDGKDSRKDQDGDEKKESAGAEQGASSTDGPKDSEMKDAAEDKAEDETEIDLEILRSSTVDIINRRRMLENELKIMRSEFQRLTHEESTMKEKIKDNTHKIENNRCVHILLLPILQGTWPMTSPSL